MNELFALAIVLFSLIIPLFWIPVHYAITFFRRIGFFTYVIPIFTWLPLSYLIYKNRNYLFQFKIDLPQIVNIIGILFFISGTFLYIWTIRLLGFWGIIGIPEIMINIKKRIVTTGPFSFVRHPTYLAHTFIFSGAFLMTEVIAVGIVTIIDFLIITTLIIPLEERELVNRFGDLYKSYKKKVTYRIIPKLF